MSKRKLEETKDEIPENKTISKNDKLTEIQKQLKALSTESEINNKNLPNSTEDDWVNVNPFLEANKKIKTDKISKLAIAKNFEAYPIKFKDTIGTIQSSNEDLDVIGDSEE